MILVESLVKVVHILAEFDPPIADDRTQPAADQTDFFGSRQWVSFFKNWYQQVGYRFSSSQIQLTQINRCGRFDMIWDTFEKILAKFGEILLKMAETLARSHRISTVFTFFSLDSYRFLDFLYPENMLDIRWLFDPPNLIIHSIDTEVDGWSIRPMNNQ